MPRARLFRLVAVPATALLLLSGCGSSGGSNDGKAGADASRSSTPKPGAPSSDHTSSSNQNAAALTRGDFGSRVYAAFHKAGTLHFELTTALGSVRSSGSGEADLRGSKVASSVVQKLPGGLGEVSAVLVDGLFYLKAPQFGPKWIKIDPKAKSGLGALVGQFGANSDPSRILKAMDAAATVTPTGTEQVDGVKTTKYHVVLPRKALIDALGIDARIDSLLPAKVEYDMWVDGDDLVRKQVSTLKVAGNSGTTTISFSKFGDPVSIKAPPARQTTTQAPRPGGTA